ncbi:MAG: hypothetical protein KAR08_11370 [Candidatus Heimdallarchaeota archaeon]|nr:hypothetical protein [Candidatus Heimdallarchaeota archaeon]
MALEKLCESNYLTKVKRRDETTNIEKIVYAVAKFVISGRKKIHDGLKGNALKLTKAELMVIDAIAVRGGSNLTLEERASIADLTPQNFKQLMEQLIIKGFVKRKKTRTGSSKRVPTIFLTKKGIEVYNIRYKRARERQHPTMPLTHHEQRLQDYEYEIKAEKKKEKKQIIIIWAVIIGIVVLTFTLLAIIL